MKSSKAPFSTEEIRRLDPYLLTYARRHVRDSELARELVQQTWESALRSNFEGRCSPKTYLVSILRRRIIDAFRSQGRRHFVSFESHHMPESAEAHHVLQHRSELRRVRDAIDTLPPRESEALLRVVHGEDRQEVAEEMGVSLGNLRVVLHRSRKRLRALAS